MSQINNAMNAGSLSATNVNKQKCVRGWTVICISVKIASRRGRATVAAKLDVGIVLHLIVVLSGTATKEYALTALSMGIVGVGSVITADWNFVPMTVVTNYKNSVKKNLLIFVKFAGTRLH